MALKYRHRVGGHTVAMLEPDELEQHLAGVTERGRSMDPKRIMLAKKRRERLLVKMNDAWKWERVDGTPQSEDEQVEPGEFHPSRHNVDEVNAYLADADEAERERVLAAEREGKARSSILNGPYADDG